VSGRPQEKEGELKVLVETAYELTQFNIDEVSAGRGSVAPDEAIPADSPVLGSGSLDQAVGVHVRASLPETVLIKLRKVFDGNPGIHPVVFLIDDIEGQRKVRSSAKISFSEDVVKQIEGVLGQGTVKIL
jgi:hypothetical protein